MPRRTLAHLSDLHFGSAFLRTAARAPALVRGLLDAQVDHVVVTGDITEAGRARDFAHFREVFAPLLAEGRLTMVPGNHDRLGDDPGAAIMAGRRVDATEVDGLYLVRVDSTGPHNRSSIVVGHGLLSEQVLDEISAALDRAPSDALVVILMHHHPVVLPEERLIDHLSNLLGLPYSAELNLGEQMLRRVMGRCDLVLHGHRHVPSARVLDPWGPRPLRVYNAGSSISRGGVNVFSHDAGVLCAQPQWLRVGEKGAELVTQAPPYQTIEYRLVPRARRPSEIRAVTVAA